MSVAPSTSKRPVTVGSRLSGAAHLVSTTTATHSGTLIAKIHRHEAVSTSQPPSTGPIAAATPESPAQVPIARARSWGRNDAWMSDSAPGVSSAAPTPWNTRRAMSWVGVWAAAHSADATRNQTTPTR